MNKKSLVCFCFLCHVPKVVSSFEHNALPTDCTLPSAGHKPNDEITVVFTNEYKIKSLVMIKPQSVNRYKLLSSDLLGSSLRNLKWHMLEDESGACTCVQWKKWAPQTSFCIEVRLLHLHFYQIWGWWVSQTWFSWWSRGDAFLFLCLLCFLQPDLQTVNCNVSYCYFLNHKIWKQSS